MTRRISLPIEGATEIECGACEHRLDISQSDGIIVFCAVHRTTSMKGIRSPACLIAEASYAALVRDARIGAAVLGVLADFGWNHAVVRAEVESERHAESVVGCMLLAIERAMRPDDFMAAALREEAER